jgi:glucose/arabinose dehydrogenase
MPPGRVSGASVAAPLPVRLLGRSSVERYNRVLRLAAVLALLIVAGCANQPGPDPVVPAPQPPATPTPSPSVTPIPSPSPSVPVGEVATVIATGLEAPWSVAFAPDGTVLVSERDSGRVVSIAADGTQTEVAQIEADGSNEGGLLGLAVSPTYATDGLVYAYYTTAADNRIVRFQLGGVPEDVLTGIPAGPIHNGGRIAFGPDGMLYAGTGDASESGNAQDAASLGGKILRMTPTGDVPADNPTPGSLVYSLGHRNVQGLAWDATGRLYATELGQNAYDEVNLISPGGNYGWPAVEGEGGGQTYIDPVATFTTAEASPSGATFLTGGAIPKWEGNLFLAALRGQRLWRLAFAPDGTVSEREALYDGLYGRLRTAAQAPDGSLWLLTSNRDGRGNPIPEDDRIIRIGPPPTPAP